MVCFWETNLKVGQTYHLKNYNGYFKNRINPGRAGAGDASFVKNNIESHQINLQTHSEAMATIVKFQIQICLCKL